MVRRRCRPALVAGPCWRPRAGNKLSAQIALRLEGESEIVSVSFVAPKLGCVLADSERQLFYRVIGKVGNQVALYELPDREDILALCQVTEQQYHELAVRYGRWLSGDKLSTPVLADHQIAGGRQAKGPEDEPSRCMRMPKAKNTKAPPVRLPRSKRAQAATLAQAAQQAAAAAADAVEPMRWQVRNEEFLLNDYHKLDQRTGKFGLSWDLILVNPNDPVSNEIVRWQDLEEVPDPIAPLLRTAQDEAEATKIEALASIVAPLDLIKLNEMLQHYGGDGVWLFAATGLQMPIELLQHALNIWCTFGEVPEGLMYTKERLAICSYQAARTKFAHIFGLEKYRYHSPQEWANQEIWICLLELMCHQYLAAHPQEALAQGNWTSQLLAQVWDQKLVDNFGAKVIEAFGGPKHSFLWQFKHSASFGPDVSHVKKIFPNLKVFCQGSVLEMELLESWGINLFSNTLVFGPPCCKSDFTYDAATRAQLQPRFDFVCMGHLLENVVQSIETSQIPAGILAFNRLEAGLTNALQPFYISSRAGKGNYNSLLVDKLIQDAQERFLGQAEPLKEAQVYFFTEPMLKHVKLLLDAGVRRIVYGLSDPKAGAWTTGTIRRISPEQLARLEVKGGVREQECRHIMELFEQRYQRRKRTPNKVGAVDPGKKTFADLEQFAQQVEQELAAQQGQVGPKGQAKAQAARARKKGQEGQ